MGDNATRLQTGTCRRPTLPLPSVNSGTKMDCNMSVMQRVAYQAAFEDQALDKELGSKCRSNSLGGSSCSSPCVTSSLGAVAIVMLGVVVLPAALGAIAVVLAACAKSCE